MYKIVVLLVINIFCVQCAKILGVFPYPSISHQVVFHKITEELLKRGHELTIITTDPVYPKEKTPANLTQIDVHDVAYETKKDFFIKNSIVGNDDVAFKTRINKKLLLTIFEAQLKLPEVQKLIKSKENFDLILIEAVIRPAYVFSQVFNAPIVLVSSLGVTLYDNKIMGNPSHPILYPSILNEKLYNLTIWEKLKIFYDYFITEYEDEEFQNAETEVLQKYFGHDVLPVHELCNNVHLLLLNLHSIWADNQPVPPNVIYFGGLNLREDKALPKDLQTFLDSSKHGVIYVSFGSNVASKLIPEHVIEAMVRVLSNLPYDVLWKWDQDELPLNPKNIKISKWFPQSDLLKHKNIKLFITQGGLQSTDEAISAGVPLIAIPMLGDQLFNADKYVRHGIGKKILKKQFNEYTFKHFVETVLKDESYRQNVVKLREQMMDQPEPPLDRAMWWIEYVIRHGGAKHLSAPAANMTWMQFIEIEVILVVFAITVSITTVVILVLILSLKLLFKKSHVKRGNKIKKK